MCRHKTAWLLAVAATPIFLSADARGQSSHPLPEGAPAIHPVDQRFLTQVIRRELEAKLSGHSGAVPAYTPPALAAVECQIVVTLREQGYVRGIGISAQKPVIPACREAALLAAASANFKKEGVTKLPDDLRIDVQALGPQIPYTGESNWMEPGALDGFLDPGLDGISLFLDGDQRWFTAAEMISKNLPFGTALQTLGKEISLNARALPDARLARFRTLHWWEIDDAGHTITLWRGMIPVPPAAVSAPALDAAIDRLAAYMVFRQRPTGRFAYEYSPAADVYTDADDEVAQSGAAWALAWHARVRGNESARTAAEHAIQERLSHVIALPTIDGAAFLATPDARNKLGATAQLCLALADSPQPERYAPQRKQLVTAMLWLQLPVGRFATAFPPADVLETQDVYPGQALLALAHCYAHEPRGEIVDAFNRALPFYRDYFTQTGSPAMVPWHMQAYARMARQTKRRDYADFVFAMGDELCAHQLTRANCRAPEMRGAFVAPDLPAGDPTAAFVAGLVEAARLAQAVGDAARAARYLEACRRGTRFVLQLQVRPEECFYMRSLRDAVDGIRDRPALTGLRIDSCQHALIALTLARQALFPERP